MHSPEFQTPDSVTFIARTVKSMPEGHCGRSPHVSRSKATSRLLTSPTGEQENDIIQFEERRLP
jgi:hypothetical protein